MAKAFTLVFSIGVTAANSCCVSLCADSECHDCSKEQCLANSACHAWSCGTFDVDSKGEDDCLFWIDSTCQQGQPLGSPCVDSDGGVSESHCEVMPPPAQRPTWAPSDATRICARRTQGPGRCRGAKQNAGTLLIHNIVNLMVGSSKDSREETQMVM